jgi:hypothetical protein
MVDPAKGHGAFHGVKPGDTIEVHWVYSSCDVAPGPGLGACLSKACANPQLRVEAQAFLLVNDPKALNFNDFNYRGNRVNELHQAKALPGGTGAPVVFAGSTIRTEIHTIGLLAASGHLERASKLRQA